MTRCQPASLVPALLALLALPGPALAAPDDEIAAARRAELAVAEELYSLQADAPAEDVARLRGELEKARSRTRKADASVSAASDSAASDSPVRPFGVTELPARSEDSSNVAVPVAVAVLGVLLLVWIARFRGDVGRKASPDRPAATRPVPVSRQDHRRFMVGIVGAVVVFGLLVWVSVECGLGVGGAVGVATALLVMVAFLARDPLRDAFKGATLLLERPFEANDVVRVGELEGVVQRIGVCSTVIRDFGGGVHHLPNREIQASSNFTRAWSRACAYVRIAYAEDLDRVLEALREAVADVRADPVAGGLLAPGGEMIGVDRYEEVGAVLCVRLEARSLREVVVEEALERRIVERLGVLQSVAELCPRRRPADVPRAR